MSDADAKRKEERVARAAEEKKEIDAFRAARQTRVVGQETFVPAPSSFNASENYFFFFPEAGVKSDAIRSARKTALCLICLMRNQEKKIWSWAASPSNLYDPLVVKHASTWQLVRDLRDSHALKEAAKKRAMAEIHGEQAKEQQQQLQVIRGSTKWGTGDPRTQKHDLEIVEELLTDGLPLSHCERTGFRIESLCVIQETRETGKKNPQVPKIFSRQDFPL